MSKIFAFDLDGTLYFGTKPASKGIEVVNALRERGDKVIFFTNNSAKKSLSIYHKLVLMGYDPEDGSVISAATAVSIYLKQHCPDKIIFAIGSQEFKEEMVEYELQLSDVPEKADVIAMGLDVNFSYETLTQGLNVLHGTNKPFIVANKDRNYPGESGVLYPGIGPLVESIIYAANIQNVISIGKPNRYMIDFLLNGISYDLKDLIIVGDTYESDILMAKTVGAASIYITNGCSCPIEIEDDPLCHVIDTTQQMYELIKKGVI